MIKPIIPVNLDEESARDILTKARLRLFALGERGVVERMTKQYNEAGDDVERVRVIRKFVGIRDISE